MNLNFHMYTHANRTIDLTFMIKIGDYLGLQDLAKKFCYLHFVRHVKVA